MKKWFVLPMILGMAVSVAACGQGLSPTVEEESSIIFEDTVNTEMDQIITEANDMASGIIDPIISRIQTADNAEAVEEAYQEALAEMDRWEAEYGTMLEELDATDADLATYREMLWANKASFLTRLEDAKAQKSDLPAEPEEAEYENWE